MLVRSPRAVSRRRTLAMGTWAAVGMALPVRAAQTQPWPGASKPIKIVVSFAAGSGSDMVVRALSPSFEAALGTTVIVENRVGAAGVIGHEYVQNAVPDGYTLLATSTAQMLILPVTTPEIKFRLNSFELVGPTGSSPYVVLVANLPAAPRTLRELLARLNNGELAFGSPGLGTLADAVSALLIDRAKLQARRVPYKSNLQVLVDLAGGQVDFATESVVGALPLVRAGKLRPLAVTSPERTSLLPQVPTTKELGIENLSLQSITALAAPLGTPASVIEKLQGTLQPVLALQAVQDRFATLGITPMPMSLAQFTAAWRAEAKFWEDAAPLLRM